MKAPSSIPANAKGQASTCGSAGHGLRKGRHYGKGEWDAHRGVDGRGSAASGRGSTTSKRMSSFSTYSLDLVASFTAGTVLERGREKVDGGGTEVVMAASTRCIRTQSAKDIGADTSPEQGIGEASSS